MHQFLPAIGFSKLNKKELEDLLMEAQYCPDYQETTLDVEGNQYVELRYFLAERMALVIRGTYDENDEFVVDYYFPTYYGSKMSSLNDVEIIKESDRESFQVVSDDTRLGMNLIFYLQNMGEFLKVSKDKSKGDTRGTYLSGLSVEGKIILPVVNFENEKARVKTNQLKRNQLVEAARDGDEAAIENLTLEDMDIYGMISKRLMNEDVLSIVMSTFLPFGIENDKYSIIGEITNVKTMINKVSKEVIYRLTVDVNDIMIDVVINKNDLLGEPAIGRRFKGNIWLQGVVDFS